MFVVTMNWELFEIMVIRLSHTPSDLSTENSIKLSLTLELIFLDHGTRVKMPVLAHVEWCGMVPGQIYDVMSHKYEYEY